MIEIFLRAFRYLKSQAKRNAVIVLILTSGMSLFLMSFTAFYVIAFKKVALPNEQSLVVIESSFDREKYATGIHWSDVKDIQLQQSSFSSLSAYSNEQLFSVYFREYAEGVVGSAVDKDFFDVAGVSPLIGRTIREGDLVEDSSGVAVISFHLWENAFSAATDILGTRFLLDGEEREVIGVMPEKFGLPLASDLWIPLSHRYLNSPRNQVKSHFALVGRLKSGVSIDAAEKELANIAETLSLPWPKNRGFRVDNIKASFLKNGMHVYLAIILSGLLIFLATCTSVLGMTTATIRERLVNTREGGDGPSVGQMFVEHLVLAILSACISLLLVTYYLRIMKHSLERLVTPTPFWFQFSLGAESLLAISAMIVVSPLITVLYPSLKLSKLLRSNLDAKFDEASGKLVRKSCKRIICIQIALVLGVAIVSGLLLASYKFASETDYGVPTDAIAIVNYSVPERLDTDAGVQTLNDFHLSIKADLLAIPGVRAVTAASYSPGSYTYNEISIVILDEHIGSDIGRGTGLLITIDKDFFTSFDIPLKSGRFPDDSDDHSEIQKVVVSDSFSNWFWLDEDPIGKRFVRDDINPNGRLVMEIVGVVKQLVMAPPYSTQRHVGLIFQNHNNSVIATGQQLFVSVEGEPKEYFERIHSKFASYSPKFSVVKMSKLDDVIALGGAPMAFISSTYGAFFFGVLVTSLISIAFVIHHIILWRRDGSEGSMNGCVLWLIRRGAFTLLGGLVLGILTGGALIFLLEGGKLD